MASGWNLCVWLEYIGVVSGCCKEVYRYPHNNSGDSTNFPCIILMHSLKKLPPVRPLYGLFHVN